MQGKLLGKYTQILILARATSTAELREVKLRRTASRKAALVPLLVVRAAVVLGTSLIMFARSNVVVSMLHLTCNGKPCRLQKRRIRPSELVDESGKMVEVGVFASRSTRASRLVSSVAKRRLSHSPRPRQWCPILSEAKSGMDKPKPFTNLRSSHNHFAANISPNRSGVPSTLSNFG